MCSRFEKLKDGSKTNGDLEQEGRKNTGKGDPPPRSPVSLQLKSFPRDDKKKRFQDQFCNPIKIQFKLWQLHFLKNFLILINFPKKIFLKSIFINSFNKRL